MAEQVNIGAYEPATAKMVLEVVRYLKKNGYLLQAGQRGQANFDAPRLHIAYTTSDVSERNDDTAGTGTATLKYIPGEPGVDDSYEDFSEGVEVPVYNYTQTKIAQDSWVMIAREYASGKWHVIPQETKRVRGVLGNGNGFTQETAADPHEAGSLVGINYVHDDSAEPTIQVYNPLGIKLWSGATVHAEWNVEEDRWEVYAATSDKVVHGVQRDTGECEFQKLDGANGWNAWDANADLPWITNVRYEDCALYYDTLCDADNLIGNIDAITNIEFNEDTCELYFYKCNNEIAGTAGQFDYVTSVYVSGGGLYYNKKCGGENLVIELTSCESTPACGTCTWTADDSLSWVQSDSCTGTCECVPPAFPASVVGQTWSTDCEEP
jgi:hypothetical protein